MKPKLGCVPFLNAKPLVAWFADGDEIDADVIFADPALLGPMVDRGEVDAAIASSFFAIADPSLKVAAGVSISSRGPVESVKLLSKGPFNEIETLALDQASMTSNHLGLIILAEEFGVRPTTERRSAHLGEMLAEFDAAILIGDAGMSAEGAGLHRLDLGAAWHSLTGMPFVWAVWVGRDGLTADLAAKLRAAKEFGMRNLETIADEAAHDLRWPYDLCLRYLTQSIDFDLGEEHLAGLELFGKKCVEMGFVSKFQMPEVVGEASASARRS
ncbi:MAG: menaquinone biosynthesis protein [Armatimonadota bacterium]|nr:menaquinone biosynthesis protein [Armatimonadota bacterium]